MFEKRTQLERLTIAETLLTSVMEELTEGKTDDAFKIIDEATNCQTEANRIVWKLNNVLGWTSNVKPDTAE